MDVWTVLSPTNRVESTAHAVRAPLRNSRARLRGPRLARKQGGILPAISKNKSGIIPMQSPQMDDLPSAVLRKVSLRHNESDVIEIAPLVFADITLPLLHVGRILRKTIGECKLPDHLVISSEQADWLAFVFDQLLAQSHMAAAMLLSRGSLGFVTSNDRLVTLPQLNDSGTITQKQRAGPSTEPSRSLNDLRTTQNLLKTTPWGTTKAEIHLIGDRLHSEILCFRVSFSPDQQLSETGVVIDYASHHINSLIRIHRQTILEEPRTIHNFEGIRPSWGWIGWSSCDLYLENTQDNT